MRHAILLAFAVAAAPLAATADGPRMAFSALPQKYRTECAACHVAYPPGALPASSWARIMSTLGHHYGTDASLDAATVNEISTWLATHAGPAREMPPQDRITQSAWFVRKHRDIAPATWKLPAVKSAANCVACHRGADQGVFDEHHVRIPR